MAKYTNPTGGLTRTEDYRFTVTDLRDFELQQLKEAAKVHNKAVREAVRSGKAVVKTYSNSQDYSKPRVSLMRVHIMPRGPRAEAAKKDYDYTAWQSGRYGQYDSYLPQRHATHFDVYFREDTHNNGALQVEQETGLRPGQQALIHKLDTEKWQLEMAQRETLRKNGVVSVREDGRETYLTIDAYKDKMRANGVPESIIDRLA
jgi:hypothetical protein